MTYSLIVIFALDSDTAGIVLRDYERCSWGDVFLPFIFSFEEYYTLVT